MFTRLITFLAIGVVFLANQSLFAQDTSATETSLWKTGGFTNFTFNQMALANWVQGGESSISAITNFNAFANYATEKLSWESTLDIGYGLINTEETDWRKTEDKIDLNSKVGYLAGEGFYYTFLFNFKSQLDDGFEFPNDSVRVSKFLAPGYFILSLGMDYKPNDKFSFYLSPTTGRLIVVNDQRLANLGSYGVKAATFDENGVMLEEGEKLEVDFGAYATITANFELMENVRLRSKLDLFNDYTDDIVSNRVNIDVNWETTLSMKVNKYISANLFTHLIYDHNIPVPIFEDVDGEEVQVGTGPRTQFKEVLGLGFSYKF